MFEQADQLPNVNYIGYKPNSFGTLYFEWTNNTGISVDLTSLTINEAGQFLFKNIGNEMFLFDNKTKWNKLLTKSETSTTLYLLNVLW